jgi:hypothetical protein
LTYNSCTACIFSGWREQLEQGVEVANIRILWRFDRSRIGLNGHHPLAQLLFTEKDRNGVVVGFGHLLAVDTGNDGGGFIDFRLGNNKGLAKGVIETNGDVAGHLHMLFLILAHRHHLRLIEQDIRGHQHRIGKQPMTGRDVLGHLVLERMATLQESHGREHGQQPG